MIYKYFKMVDEAKNIYFDTQFIQNMNELENYHFSQLISLVIENLSYDINHEKLSYISKIFHTIFAVEKNPLNIYRKLKSLIHCCIYNRFSKKFKNEMLTLGFKQDKLDILCDLVKPNIDSLNDKLKISELTSYLKDFEIKTEMPISFTNYKISTENKDIQNIDYKKQSLNMNLTINNNRENKEIFFEISKSQLLSFFEEIEKIQEKLDKLY